MTPDALSGLIAGLRPVLEPIVRQLVVEALAESRAPAEFLLTSEAAHESRVSVGTIRRWIREGRLKKYGAGRQLRVSSRELAGLMRHDGRRQPPISKRKRKAPDRTPEELAEEFVG